MGLLKKIYTRSSAWKMSVAIEKQFFDYQKDYYHLQVQFIRVLQTAGSDMELSDKELLSWKEPQNMKDIAKKALSVAKEILNKSIEFIDRTEKVRTTAYLALKHHCQKLNDLGAKLTEIIDKVTLSMDNLRKEVGSKTALEQFSNLEDLLLSTNHFKLILETTRVIIAV